MTTPQRNSAAEGRVFDIGYQKYEGPREGRNRARMSIYKDGIKNALGLGRGPRAKILPWLFIGVLVLVAGVMALVAGAADLGIVRVKFGLVAVGVEGTIQPSSEQSLIRRFECSIPSQGDVPAQARLPSEVPSALQHAVSICLPSGLRLTP